MFDFSLIFAPIVWIMDLVLSFYNTLTGSLGLSILLLSVTFSLLLLPLQKKGMQIERRVTAKMQLVREEVQSARQSGLSGEVLFNETERIYLKNSYHPIHGIATASGFLVMLPVLISSIILFRGSLETVGVPFLFIQDLSRPDQLMFGLNALPPLMFVITLLDAFLRYPNDKAAKVRFLIISIALFGLVYAMPSGLVLYWIGNNLTAFAMARLVVSEKPRG